MSRREALGGLGALLLAVVPAYLMARDHRASSAVTAEAALAGTAEAAAIEEEEDAASEVTLQEIESHIREVATRYGVSPRLVAAIIEAESSFNPRAVSRRGARGLMQLMPATASYLAITDSFDPYKNIEGGVRHLRQLIDRFNGNLPLVLAAYNAGEGAVRRYGGVPPYRETRRYVARILRRLRQERSRRRAGAVVLVSARARGQGGGQ